MHMACPDQRTAQLLFPSFDHLCCQLHCYHHHLQHFQFSDKTNDDESIYYDSTLDLIQDSVANTIQLLCLSNTLKMDIPKDYIK